jgi:DNA-binding CsgD family transcriptional regulator
VPIFKASSQFPQDFMERYKNDDFYNQDFTIREIKAGNLKPKDWKTYEQSGDLSEQELNVIRLAREQYGIENALSIPAMNQQTSIAGASLISSKSDDEYQEMLRQHQQTLVNCTRIFNDIVMQYASSDVVHTFVFTTLPKITLKQRQVLRELLKGTLQNNIGTELGMTQSAVDNHLANLRNAFEVKKTHDLKHLLETLNILDYL